MNFMVTIKRYFHVADVQYCIDYALHRTAEYISTEKNVSQKVGKLNCFQKLDLCAARHNEDALNKFIEVKE